MAVRRRLCSPRATLTLLQGPWKVDGIGVPESVLRKLHEENAAHILEWKPGAGPAPAAPGPPAQTK